MAFPLVAVLSAMIACVILGRSAAALVLRMRPRQAVVLVTAAALTVSVAGGVALTAIAVGVVAGLSSVAADGHWSAAVIRAELPIPVWLGVVSAVTVSVLLLRAVVRTVTISRAMIRAERLCRELRTGAGPIVIVDDGSADAYTVAGLRGCVVIGRRLLLQLSNEERRILTGHELSHLNNRHHLFVHIADIAVAANPLLGPVSAAVRLGVERWADEDAAAALGDRRRAGRALARVALLRSSLGTEVPAGSGSFRGPWSDRTVRTLSVAGSHVVSRVQALLQPAPQGGIGRLVGVVVLALAVLATGIASMDYIHEAIEMAAGG
jgi:beta-lactamase regulating signal transducer with metallopeptidase domain